MLLPQQRTAGETLHNRLMEDMQHPAAKTEGLELPQEVKSALTLLINSISVHLQYSLLSR